MDTDGNALREIIWHEAYWIAFVQIVFVSPVLQTLPSIRLASAPLRLILGGAIAISAMATLFLIPLLIAGNTHIPRDPDFRRAYFFGFLSGALATHVLWVAIRRTSLVQKMLQHEP